MQGERETLLALKNVTKRYPGVVALNNVSMDFRKGEVHALLGENGAGKSTLIKAITGAVSIDEGSIIFDGKSHSSLTTSVSRELGISAVYQESNLIKQISVADNVFLGDYIHKKGFVDEKYIVERTAEILESLGYHLNPRMPSILLSEAQKQIVEISRSLVRELKLIIFDEPTSALMNSEVDSLFRVIGKLKERGITVIYITHRIEELFRIADRVTIMRDGKYIKTVNTSETTRAELVSAMVGREFVEMYPRARREAPGKTVLEVKGLCGRMFRDISFSVREGEILGFAGLIGAGRTETARGIFGADPIQKGEILIKGRSVKLHSPRDAIREGIGYIPEERKEQGLFLGDSIRHNVSISCISRFTTMGFVKRSKENRVADDFCSKMRVKAPGFNEIVMNLSGGNQQKVLVAKWLATQCDVLFFDEPTRGIDVGARSEIYELMAAMAGEGIAIVLISSDMMEVIGMSDRVIVFYEGSMMGELSREELTQERIMDLASGHKIC